MNEADRRKEFELDVIKRLEDLESIDREGAIARNAQAMKETIEQWNKEFVVISDRLDVMEKNFLVCLEKMKQLEDNNARALQRILGHGPTA